MKKNKTLKILSIAITCLIIFLIIANRNGWINHGTKVTVETEQLQKRTIVETVSANGKVQPEVEVKISADVSGEIVELHVKEGDEVKKGDLLVKINPDIYISMKERAVAALNTAKANLANAKARLSQVKAQFINTSASFTRNQSLIKEGAISPSEFDAAQAAHEVAKAEVEAAQQSVLASDYNVKSAGASLKEAGDNLLKTTIFAPMSGTVSMLAVEAGERVVGTSQMAGTEMMRIANLKEMEVNVDVNENDIVRLSLGDTTDIEVDAYTDRKFKGIVTQIANSAKTLGLSADQVTNFEVKIRVLRSSYEDLLNKEKLHLSPFRPGMSATVEIQTNTVYNVLSAPIQAVTTREDTVETNLAKIKTGEKGKTDPVMQECIFVCDNGVAKLQKVKTGIQDNKYIEIISGLGEKQEVITGPYSAVSKELDEGDMVEIKIEEAKEKRKKT